MPAVISVIVPVYKVEKYLRRCVDSVLSQSYPHFELLLVDDGSPDGCPAICDAYARRDPRVRVIHQANAGLSGARNTGLDAARGDCIAFLDSDDWLEPTMLQQMTARLEKAGADLAFCGHCADYEATGKSKISAPPEGTLDRDGFRRLLCGPRGNNFVWNKLYRRSLWEDLRFPVGKYYEDIYVMNTLMGRCRKAVCFAEPLCHYTQRSSSITRSRADLRLLDGVQGCRERLALVQDDAQLAVLAKQQLVRFLLWAEYMICALGADEKLEARRPELHRLLAENGGSLGPVLAAARWAALHTPALFAPAARCMAKRMHLT